MRIGILILCLAAIVWVSIGIRALLFPKTLDMPPVHTPESRPPVKQKSVSQRIKMAGTEALGLHFIILTRDPLREQLGDEAAAQVRNEIDRMEEEANGK